MLLGLEFGHSSSPILTRDEEEMWDHASNIDGFEPIKTAPIV